MFKNKYINISITILLIVFIAYLLGENIYLKNKESIDIYRRDNKGTFKNTLSMMLETDLDSGEYERSTGTQWPTEGYIFNKELSKCENGGELDWDSVNNQVLMIGASSDKCYVYFDRYASITINNLSLSSTPTSITATISATAGSASISKYMFSINNGAYIESDSNVHTFVGLNSSTEYSISVKVVDANGKTSSVTTETIETSAYVNLSITNVASNVAWNQIKVTVTASNGTNNVSKYYYSINGGTYQESTNNTYTFTGLNASTAYTIKTKVMDTADKYSSERTDTISTAAYVNPTITNLTTSVTASTIKVTSTVAQGTASISKYYYSKDGGSSYTESTSNNYTFTGLTGGTNYNIKVYVKDDNGKTSNTYTKSVSTTNPTLAAYIKGLYTSQGSNGIYLHNSSLANSANDNSYRYTGANPNNYVCFGSTASPCPTDNLYRIIGIFGDQVKLIKSTLATSTMLGTNGAYSSGTSYYWNNSTYKNTWSESNLNTVNLNTNYISYFGTTWTNKIATTTWKVAGNTYEKLSESTAPNVYQNEIVSPAANTTYSAKIGLMYVSDYGYAAAPSAWTTTLDSYNSSSVTGVNWMYSGVREWTLIRRSNDSNVAFAVYSLGFITDSYGPHEFEVNIYDMSIRPVFYLTSSVTRTGGTGTSSDPYRIA